MHHAAKQAREIADRKRAEEFLRDSEAGYRIFFENNPLPGWVVDSKSHKFLAVNEAAIRHYGYSREEFLALTLGDIESFPDTGADAGADAARRHVRKNGTIIDVDIVSHRVPGPPPCELMLVYDVTESAERLDLALRAAVQVATTTISASAARAARAAPLDAARPSCYEVVSET